MALTPEDVSNKRFTTVRLREGYDMTEVDQFLDEVEAELGRLTRENDELRAKLRAAQAGEPLPEPEPAAAPTPVEPEEGAEVEPPAEPERPAGPVVESPPARATRALETITVTTTSEASAAATRLLELAGRNADELVSEAREQADKIVGEARSTAERLDADSRSRAESLEAEARTRAEALDAETEERRRELFGDIEREKSELEVKIEGLRTFEREYRAELRTYFEEQLAALDGQGAGGALPHRAEDLEGASGSSSGDEDREGSPLQSVLGDGQVPAPGEGEPREDQQGS